MMRITLPQGLLLAAAVAITAEAHAQTAPSTDQGPSETTLAEIMVTAQKRAESINTVPISISAVSQEDLDVQGLKSIEDLARTVPGLVASPGGALDTNISIRGILTNVGAATTGVYIDETPIASRYICFYCGYTAYPKLFDLQRVEVLRGPQGTLFGAGSEGGTIRFITPSPGLTSYSGYSRAEFATTQYGAPSYEIGSAFGGPILQNQLGFRASLWTRTDGGYIDLVNPFTGELTDRNSNSQKSYVGRIALTWQPSESLSVTPSFFWQKLDEADRPTFWPAAGLLRSFNQLRQPNVDTQRIASMNVSYVVSGLTLKSVTSYYGRDQQRIDDYTSSDFAYYAGVETAPPGLENYTDSNYQTTTQSDWTQEFRISSDSDRRVSFTAGIYLANGATAFQQREVPSDFEAFSQTFYGASVEQVFGEPLLNGAAYLEQQSQRDKEYALFGELDYRLSEHFKLSAGARYAYEKFVFNDRHDGPLAGGLFTTPTVSASAQPVTPRLSLSYLDNDTLIYATFAKGFRQGGGNASLSGVPSCVSDIHQLFGANATDVPGSYAPDSVKSYEVGAKSRLAGGRATVSGSVYWVDWNSIQTNVLLPTCGYNYTANVGAAVSRGFDLQAALRPVRGMTLGATVGYDDAYNTKSLVTNGNYLIHKGSLLLIPGWTGTGSVEYELPLEGAFGIYGRADYQYQAAYSAGYVPGDIGYDPTTANHASLKFTSARAGMRVGGSDISLFADNLFNSRPTLSLGHDLPQFGNFRGQTLRPRTIGLTATFHY